MHPALDATRMTVLRLDVDSFKRMRAAHVTPSPTGLVPVRGGNAQGKSSLIEAMLSALLGRRGALEVPITEGAHGAEVVLDLGEIVVKRRWKRDSGGTAKTSLSVEGKDGLPFRSPQAILDTLVGQFADPVAFLSMQPAEQVKTVLAVTGLDAQLQELEDKAAMQFDRRRDLGREADRLTKAADTMKVELGDVATAPPTEAQVTLTELTSKLQAARDHNAKVAAVTLKRDEVAEHGKKIAARIDELKKSLASAQEEYDVATNSWKECDRWLKDPASMLVDLTQYETEIATYEERARLGARLEAFAEAKANATTAQANHASADAELNATRTEIVRLLDDAKFPIEGMAYDSEKKLLTVGGIPFSQASQSERIRVAAAVAMAGDPAIRVVFAREGSLLDDTSRMQIAKLAEESGFQLWLECVDSTREGSGIWIEDGEAIDG